MGMRYLLPSSIALGSASLGASLLVLGGTVAFATEPHTLPEGGEVVRGDAYITQNGARLDVRQTTDRALIDWRSFDIGEDATVIFAQPGADSIAVNRINQSTDPTQIDGRLTANGHVWVLNPNGVMFGANAVVDVGGLVASTGRIDADRFMAGDMRLEVGAATNGIVSNAGDITIRDAGLAAFVAPAVRNNGIIRARLGKVTLAAGETFTLDLAGDRLVEIGLGASNALTEQLGHIEAEGGVIALTASAAGAVVDSVVNVSGFTSAASVERVGGTIILAGSDVRIDGALDVSGSGGGGSIDIAGDVIETGTVSALRADALGHGDGGQILAYADDLGRYDGQFSARGGESGGDGGFVETSGGSVRIAESISVSTLATAGTTGTWSIDPDTLTVVASGGDGTSTVNADTVVTQLNTTSVNLEANETITVDAEIDSTAQDNNHTLSFVDQNDDDSLTVNLNADIKLASTQTLTGEATTVNVRSGGSVQDAIDVIEDGSASASNLVNVHPGTYNELTRYNGVSTIGLVVDKSFVTLQGVSDAGAAITSWENVEATIVSGDQSPWGTNFFVTGNDVTVSGLGFEARTRVGSGRTTINKAFEMIADNFTMTHSIVAAAGGFDYDGVSSSALYFGDPVNSESSNILNNFSIDGNRVHGGLTITNGAGDGDSVNFSITDNIFSGNHFLRVRGEVDNVGWLNASAHVPTTVTGNDFSAVDDYVLQVWGNDARNQVDADFVTNLFANNTVGSYVYALDGDGNPGFVDYTEYGGTAPAFFVEKSDIAGVIANAAAASRIMIGDGTYTLDSALNIDKSLTLSGQSEAGTIIDASALDGYGVYVSADDVGLSDFTLYSAAADADERYGIEVRSSAGASALLAGFSVSDVTIHGAGRAELNLDGVSGATVADLTADGLTVNGEESLVSGIVTATEHDIVFSDAIVLAGDTSLRALGDGASIVAAAIDGASAGGQTLSMSASGDVSIGSLGETVRLGSTSIAGSAIALNGTTYHADDLTFNGPVTLTQTLTTFDTTRSATQAGDIIFTDDIFGSSAGAQSLALLAGDGTGAATSNGDITLRNAGTEALELGSMNVTGDDFSAATVRLDDTYDAVLTGSQTFTDETLYAGGGVRSLVEGHVSGPIVSLGGLLIEAGGDVSGDISAVEITIGAENVDATITADERADVHALGDFSGSVSAAKGDVRVEAGGDVSGAISGVGVTISAGNVDATITADEHADLYASGDFTGSVTAATGEVEAQTVEIALSGGDFAVEATAGSVTGDAASVSVGGEGVLDVNGQPIVGDSLADFNEYVVDNVDHPYETVLTMHGDVRLPESFVSGPIDPASGTRAGAERRAILVNDTQDIGSLIARGFDVIVLDLSGDSTDNEDPLPDAVKKVAFSED